MLLSLLNTPGNAHMLDLCHFTGSCNLGQPVQHLLCGPSKKGCFLHGLQVVDKPPQLSLAAEVGVAHRH